MEVSFHVLVIMKSAVINRGECRYLFRILISFPLYIYPEVGSLDQMVVLFLTFGAISTVLHNGYTNVHSHQQCTRMLSLHHNILIILWLFDNQSFWQVWTDIYCGFDLHCLMISDVENIFIYLFITSLSLLEAVMVFHKSCRLSSFLFFSSWLNIVKRFILEFEDSFFSLIKYVLKLSICIFFIHCIL